MKEFDLQNIFTDIKAGSDKTSTLKAMAKLFAQMNQMDENQLAAGFEEREAESTTGFGNGVAIPHAKISGLSQPIVGITTFDKSVEWQSLDEKPVEIAIALIMPLDDPHKEHLTVLSKFARKLMDDEFIAKLQENRHDSQKLYDLITSEIDFN